MLNTTEKTLHILFALTLVVLILGLAQPFLA